MRNKNAVLILLVSVLPILSMPVHADNAKLVQLIEILKQKGTLNQEEYLLLRGAAEAPKTETSRTEAPKTETSRTEAPKTETQSTETTKTEAPVSPLATAPKVQEPESTLEIKTTGGLKVKSKDGAYEFNVGGRIQVDSAFYRDDVADNADGIELRRARLDVDGKIEKDWKFKLAFDFADNQVADKSLYVAYEGWDVATLKGGLFTMPFGLSEATSSLFGTFMEDAMVVSAFKPDDRLGLGLESGGNNWSAQMAVFGEGPEANSVDDEAWGTSARITWAPILDSSTLLHLGGTAVYQTPDSVAEGANDFNGNGVKGENVRFVRFRSRPEAHVNVGRLVDTKAIYNVNSITSFGLESAAMRGPFSMEGEYFLTQVARPTSQSDLRFNGYYGTLSWFITGESRPYKAKSGSFTRVKPLQNFSLKQGGTGAWELATRYSVLDLTDKAVMGGVERNITLGLNWYVNPQLRMMANYVWVNTSSINVRDNPSLLETRLQVDF